MRCESAQLAVVTLVRRDTRENIPRARVTDPAQMLRRVYMCAITYVYLVSHRDVGGRQAMVVVPAATTFAYLRTAHARNRRDEINRP